MSNRAIPVVHRNARPTARYPGGVATFAPGTWSIVRCLVVGSAAGAALRMLHFVSFQPDAIAERFVPQAPNTILRVGSTA